MGGGGGGACLCARVWVYVCRYACIYLHMHVCIFECTYERNAGIPDIKLSKKYPLRWELTKPAGRPILHRPVIVGHRPGIG